MQAGEVARGARRSRGVCEKSVSFARGLGEEEYEEFSRCAEQLVALERLRPKPTPRDSYTGTSVFFEESVGF